MCKTLTGRKLRRGMTLVEVLFASFLFMLGIAGALGAVMLSLRLNYASAQQFAAFGLCKDLYEQMRSADYTNITAATFPSQTLQLTHLGGDARKTLNCQRTSVIAERANPQRKVVKVTTQWSYRGKTLSETLTGVVYKKR
jgi:Tfp pilus assembly protein PilV